MARVTLTFEQLQVIVPAVGPLFAYDTYAGRAVSVLLGDSNTFVISPSVSEAEFLARYPGSQKVQEIR
jgi:hypothetical protein